MQECWKHGKINFQASGRLKDLSISASTRENQSSSGLSFSSLTSKSSQPVSGSEYGTAG